MPRRLSNGSQGDDVTFLQGQLNAKPTALPPLVVDGAFGPITLARVQEFQVDHGLPSTGEVDPPTWAGLVGHRVVETKGFSVLGRHVYDRLGGRIVLRGVNKMSVWDNDDPYGSMYFPQIRQTGANTVRIVWAITSDLKPAGPATSTARLDALITNARANHLIPMIELHDATCNWSRLNELVKYWTQPAVVAIIQAHEEYLLVNIGNEVGNDGVLSDAFVAGYSDAVLAMRDAGIHTPLVIDASDCGKALPMLSNSAATLLADPIRGDPDGNLVFSVHAYWPMSCGENAAAIRKRLQEAVTVEYPLVVGEFSRYGGEPCGAPGATNCSPEGEVDYQSILSACNDLELGWYAWEWGPGNEYGDPPCPEMNMTSDGTFNHLNPGWGKEVAVLSPFGIQQTAITPGWL